MPYLLLSILTAVFWAASCGSLPTSPGGGTEVVVVTGPLDLGPFAVGESIDFTFATPGTFKYNCSAHTSVGNASSVEVDDDGADSVVVQIAANGSFAPSTARIRPGGYVRWVNASSAANHTVTSD